MFDQISPRVWLLLAILVIAFAPARYVYMHIASSPSRHDITQPAEDLSWRTSGQLARQLAFLALLAAIAVFIFTPAAERFGRSGYLPPTIMFAVGGVALWTVAMAFRTGRIEPMSRGSTVTFDRQTQPKRFWASMAWNGALGCTMLWAGFGFYADAETKKLENSCYGDAADLAPKAALPACSRLLEESDGDDVARASLLNQRGLAYLNRHDHRSAVNDFDNAIRLNPRESAAFFNRALAHQRLGDLARAIADYSAVTRLKPDEADAHINRAWLFLDMGKTDQAIADFDRVLALRPKDVETLAGRIIGYAYKRDFAHARRDVATARAIDPSNLQLLRAEATLGLETGDLRTAVDRLTSVLNKAPEDEWALRLRTRLYRELGEDAKWRVDADRLYWLRKKIREGEAARQ